MSATITFAGNLAGDPELRFTPNGKPVVKFTVIENRRRRTPDGQGWEDAEPNVYRVEAWGTTAENLAESSTKGDRLLVTGSIVTDRWIDKETRADRTAQHIKAVEVAVSLRFHTVQATKVPRATQHPDSEDSTSHS